MITKKEDSHFFANDITGDLTAGRQQVDVHWRAGTFMLDEPIFAGGQDLAPDPFTAVIAGLIGCTLTTLRMYIRHKGWDITDIHIAANLIQHEGSEKSEVFRKITFHQPLSDEQREKLLHIARNCPVARLLRAGLDMKIDLDGLQADESNPLSE